MVGAHRLWSHLWRGHGGCSGDRHWLLDWVYGAHYSGDGRRRLNLGVGAASTVALCVQMRMLHRTATSFRVRAVLTCWARVSVAGGCSYRSLGALVKETSPFIRRYAAAILVFALGVAGSLLGHRLVIEHEQKSLVR